MQNISANGNNSKSSSCSEAVKQYQLNNLEDAGNGFEVARIEAQVLAHTVVCTLVRTVIQPSSEAPLVTDVTGPSAVDIDDAVETIARTQMQQSVAVVHRNSGVWNLER
ncbi:hypothetical protein TYRP_010737 [Tyrophagus putrescentiae]|nr:hypothetical protein TYRP_010737 [Tyrophagus putrescentiae]